MHISLLKVFELEKNNLTNNKLIKLILIAELAGLVQAIND